MEHLLLIHIGPMQAFIAAARRTRDLWFGSWLMSELSKAAARGILEQVAENELIFPAADLSQLQPDSAYGVSNKIVALVINPQQAAQAAEDALDKRYKSLIESASIKEKISDSGWDMANKQLHSFLEFYWVSSPSGDNYHEAYVYADVLLSARKNVRTFPAVNWDGNGRPKSSLDGKMETVIPPKLGAHEMYKRFRARSGEQLSGVDLLKRLGQSSSPQLSRFPSTSHMATMPLYHHLKQKEADSSVVQKWNEYLDALPAEVKKQEVIYHRLHLPLLNELDGSLLFESRLLEYVERDDLRPLKKKLGIFLKEAEIAESDLNPYYALLVADGDFMGAAINAITKPDEHQAFSRELAQFAVDARKIVEEDYSGAVIYAGGDDVLALLPLHTAVSAAAKLAQTFRQQMAGLTFSAGIAIVHHLEPLEDALQLARDAEKEAKSFKREIDGTVYKKNALAIVLDKRGGAPRLVVGGWDDLDTRLLQFAAYYRQKELPKGLPHQLRAMFLQLGGHGAVSKTPNLISVLAKEAERIIKRKEGSEAAAAYVQMAVAQLNYPVTSIETLSGELVIAAHIAQVQELAQQEESI